MVFICKKKKAVIEHAKIRKYLTIALHVGGTFTNSRSTGYFGSKTIHIDWCKADKVSVSLLKSFDDMKTRVECDRRYHLKMKNESYKIYIDDIRKWLTNFLTVREIHVFAELMVNDDSEEDSDYMLEDESSDDDEGFYKEIGIIEFEYDVISTVNVFIEGHGIRHPTDVQEKEQLANVQGK